MLQYNKLSEITDDIDDARVYGGIHFRYDQEEGGVQGTDIGRYVYKEKLRCLRRCNSDEGSAVKRQHLPGTDIPIVAPIPASARFGH